jgi:hypothetical protein
VPSVSGMGATAAADAERAPRVDGGPRPDGDSVAGEEDGGPAPVPSDGGRASNGGSAGPTAAPPSAGGERQRRRGSTGSECASKGDSVDSAESLRSPVHWPGEDGHVLAEGARPFQILPTGALPDAAETAALLEAEEEEVFNPFQLSTAKSIKLRSENVCSALNSTCAAELTLECRQMSRLEFFARNNMFVVVRAAGREAGTWDELDRTEVVADTRSPQFIRKIRLPASTAHDRDAPYQLHVYNAPADGNVTDLADMELVGTAQTSVAELLAAKQMSAEQSVLSPRSGRSKGCVVLTLEMIWHEQRGERTVFDFGFTEDAPVRNRIFFVVSRAIQKGRFSPIYRSEIQTKELLSKFEDVGLDSQELHGGDPTRLFRIEVYRYYKSGETALLGFVQTSLEKLKTCRPGAQLYWWPAISGFSSVRFKLISVKIDESGGMNWFVMRLTGSEKQ